MIGRFLRAPNIAEAMLRPYDNFAALRLALALAVVVSHGFSVATGRIEDEPLTRLTGFTLGEHAVNGFFAISGFLVAMSFDRRGWRDYVIARALRIAPGLVAAVLVTALVIGGLMSRLPFAEYLADPGLRRFVVATLTSFKSNIALPGVFETNPFTFPMGTVWTLKYEVLCYAGVLAAGVAGLLRRWPALLLVGKLAIAIAVVESLGEPPKGVETALRLPLIFAAGSAAYLWRARLPVSLSLALALAAAAALLVATPLYKPLLFLATAYGLLCLALAPRLSHPALDWKTDLSYGAYLYGWPIQQSLHALLPAASTLALLGLSLALTLAVAALSWFLVEKPALGLKARALGRRTLGTIEPAVP